MEMTSGWDIDKLKADTRAKGWLPQDLAREAGVTAMTVSRVFRGLRANPRTMKKLAKALGHSVRRYIVGAESAVAS